MKKITPPPKPAGRPKIPDGLRRDSRLSMRTHADVAIKAALLGTAAVEALIRAAKLPKAQK